MNTLDIHVDVVRTDGLPDNHLMDVFLAIHGARFQIEHWTRVPGGRWVFGISHTGTTGEANARLERLFVTLGQPLENVPAPARSSLAS
jgi:hypothetical protein